MRKSFGVQTFRFAFDKARALYSSNVGQACLYDCLTKNYCGEILECPAFGGTKNKAKALYSSVSHQKNS